MAQVGPVSLGGRGKKFCGNLPRNLRAELPQLERDKLVAEWCRLVGKESQVAQIAPSRPQYEKRGEREVARQLGLDRDDVRRAFKVASLTPEAQQAAHDVGLADNRAALLEAASGGQALFLPGKIVSQKIA